MIWPLLSLLAVVALQCSSLAKMIDNRTKCYRQLADLKSLFESNVLSRDEYDTEKAVIIGVLKKLVWPSRICYFKCTNNLVCKYYCNYLVISMNVSKFTMLYYCSSVSVCHIHSWICVQGNLVLWLLSSWVPRVPLLLSIPEKLYPFVSWCSYLTKYPLNRV